MTDSLFKIYKKFYQRAYRNPDNIELQIISDTIYETVKELYYSFNNPVEFSLIKAKAKVTFKEINRKEIEMSPAKLFSPDLIVALNKKNIDFEIPYQVIQRWNSENRDGLIYILTSESKDGCCKLGATTMTMHKRIYFYELRYGYSVQEYFSKKVMSPLQLELTVSNKMKKYRVSGNTNGESNEWYSCDPKFLKSQILLELKNYRVTIVSLDANALWK